MSKWLCCLYAGILFHAGILCASESSDGGEFDRQFSLLDRISYTPSLLPVVMQNVDYLELTPDQVRRLRDWRNENAPALLKKISEVAQSRIEFADLSLDPHSTKQQLVQQQQRLFKLQEQVLVYKLSCRQNILETFTPKQWDSLQFLLTERQMDAMH